MKTAVISGVSGQDGSYLAKYLLEKNYKVVGLVRNDHFEIAGHKYLKINNLIQLVEIDLLDEIKLNSVLSQIKPSEIYHLAAQSSVGESFKRPKETFNFNINSTLNFLNWIKDYSPQTKYYQASSSEIYGKVEQLPICESTPLHPLSPYAVSKASAHWATINYRESFGLFACCGILFNHESVLRRDNFFVKKVIKEALEIKNGQRSKMAVGNIEVKRDFGYGPKYVEAMYLMLQQPRPEDFMICSGHSVSLKEILEYVFEKVGIEKSSYEISKDLYRPVDIKDIYGNNQKAKDQLGWNYDLNFFEILDILIQEEKDYSAFV
ncbi:MAG: GDP-mannose 4,6-dehydratase [Halobacteriovoraceae bacterium]|nr:GDP-mannose 4,6-dehydratase [Halobacteriovoraceae bacterium]